MDYAQVINGRVANVLLWDGVIAQRPEDWPEGEPWAPFPQNLEGQLVPVPEGQSVQIGDLYENGQFSAPPAPPAPPAPVPTTVTARQGELALHDAGKLQDILDALDALQEPERTRAQIEWRRATVFERFSPLLALLAATAGLTESDLDDLFTHAATL